MMDVFVDSGLLRLALTLAGCIAALAIVRLIPVRKEDRDHPNAGGMFTRQVAMVVGAVVAVVMVILALPIDTSLRAQLISLFGLALTALFTLSSTTFVSNAMAGLMLRSLGKFHAGDFIRVAEHVGRVTERGLLHSEIQTEDRDLLTLPNLYLITQPVRVVRSSGTLVSVDVSLGYDVPRTQVFSALEAAALEAELADPFVRITSLADHAVCYRVSAFLAEVRTLISARARLHATVLDSLHDHDIEIVSPAFMVQRPQSADTRTIPTRTRPAAPSAPAPVRDAEAIMFDKAETAARIKELERERELLAAAVAALEDPEGPGAELEPRRRDIELRWRQRQLRALDEVLADAAAEDADEDTEA